MNDDKSTDPITKNRDYILVKDMASDDRPREKMLRLGPDSLSNAELLAIIFGNGVRGKSVITMSQELLAANANRLSNIARKSIKDIIRENNGIGEAKAIALRAAIELGMRCRDEMPLQRHKITGSTDAYNAIRHKLEFLNHEEFWVILLSRSAQVIDKIRISQGGTAATVVDSKLLYKRVLEYGDQISAIILAHNHPSGQCKPSTQDDNLTKKLVEAGKLLDITVADHIIVLPGNGYYSYADEGRLN